MSKSEWVVPGVLALSASAAILVGLVGWQTSLLRQEKVKALDAGALAEKRSEGGLISLTRKGFGLVAFESVVNDKVNQREVVALDCFSTKVDAITHHRTNSSTEKAQGLTGDTSTELVLNALSKHHPVLEGKTLATCNHFDIDAFTSITAFLLWDTPLLHPSSSVAGVTNLQSLLVETSRIGDFRELDYDALQNGNKTVDLALKLCCLLNTLERKHFARPFEDTDKEKWDFFLRDESVAKFILTLDAEPTRDVWEKEYERVLQDCKQLNDPSKTTVQRHADLGLVVVETTEPVHYYALFSLSKGFDMVLSMYQGQRYELEQKYTAFVELTSRPILPRVCLSKLAKVLKSRFPDENWTGNRYVDSGPLLRIEDESRHLTKAERYGHPFERPIFASKCPPQQLKQIVCKALTEGLKGQKRKPSPEWNFTSLREFNSTLRWETLAAAV